MKIGPIAVRTPMESVAAATIPALVMNRTPLAAESASAVAASGLAYALATGPATLPNATALRVSWS